MDMPSLRFRVTDSKSVREWAGGSARRSGAGLWVVVSGCGGRPLRGCDGHQYEAEREGPADEPAAEVQPRGTLAAKRLGHHALSSPLGGQRLLDEEGGVAREHGGSTGARAPTRAGVAHG